MNCETSEKFVLLEQSGELSPFGQWRLHRHLASCPGCREFGRNLETITTAARMESPDVSSEVVEHLLRVAGKEQSRSYLFRLRPGQEPLAATWRYAFVYLALGITLLTGLALIALHRSQNVQTARVSNVPVQQAAWSDGLDTQISELNTDVAGSSDDWNGTLSDSEDVNTMASELLKLEGIEI